MVIKLFRHHWQTHFAILAAGDLLVSGVAFLLATRFMTPWDSPSVAWSMVYAVSVAICVAAMGLYSARQRSGLLGIFLRLLVSVGVATLLCLLISVWLPADQQALFTIFAVAGVVVLVSATLIRVIMEYVANEDLLKKRVLMYGAGAQALSIARLRRRSDHRGFVILGYVQCDGDAPAPEVVPKLLPPHTVLREFCREHAVDEIVVAMDDRRKGFPMDQLLDCRLYGIEITELITFLERETGKLRLDVLNPSWMIFSEGFRRGRVHAVLERLLDLVASLLLSIVALPFMILTAIAIKIEDGWHASILYRQKRVGQYGRTFDVLKFRSMREDAERNGKPQWATKNDARVTRVGDFIRKTRIDELPQIFNVVRGEMSFVGPRPERPEFVQQLSERIPYYNERHNVKPGVTGWAQICYPYGSSEQDALEKLQYDLYFVKNHSLLFYIGVLIQTVEVIIWRKGSR